MLWPNVGSTRKRLADDSASTQCTQHPKVGPIDVTHKWEPITKTALFAVATELLPIELALARTTCIIVTCSFASFRNRCVGQCLVGRYLSRGRPQYTGNYGNYSIRQHRAHACRSRSRFFWEIFQVRCVGDLFAIPTHTQTLTGYYPQRRMTWRIASTI